MPHLGDFVCKEYTHKKKESPMHTYFRQNCRRCWGREISSRGVVRRRPACLPVYGDAVQRKRTTALYHVIILAPCRCWLVVVRNPFTQEETDVCGKRGFSPARFQSQNLASRCIAKSRVGDRSSISFWKNSNFRLPSVTFKSGKV